MEPEADAEAEEVKVADEEDVAVEVALLRGVTLVVDEDEACEENDGVGELDAEALVVGVFEALGDSEGVGEALPDALSEAWLEGVRAPDDEGVEVREATGVVDDDAVVLGDAVDEAVVVGEAKGDSVCVEVLEGEELAVAA